MTLVRVGERLDQRLLKLLGFAVELLVAARPLPRGRVRYGDRCRQLGRSNAVDRQLVYLSSKFKL